MEFGINIFPTGSAVGTIFFADSLALAEAADAHGFAHVRSVEHHYRGYGGGSPNPLLFLAAAAARTARVRLVIGCVVPAFNHPVKIASEIAMLDAISAGRVEAGFARAFIPAEFDLFEIPVNESSMRFNEGIEQVRLMLAEESVTCDGDFHRLDHVTSLPRPVQWPHPPLWIAAVATPQSFAHAGREGFGLMTIPQSPVALRDLIAIYRDAWSSSGRRGRGRVMIGFHMVCAPTEAEAARVALPSLDAYQAALVGAMSAWRGRASGAYAGYADVLHRLEQEDGRSLIARRAAWVGDPSHVLESVLEYSDSVGGFDVASMQVNFAGIEGRTALRSMSLFAEEVMPRIPTSAATA